MPGGCRNVGWSFIRKRRKLSIARMMIEGNGMLRRSLIFWAIRFAPEARRVARESTSSTSVRPFLRKLARPYGERFETGSCIYAATRRLRIFPVCLTRSSGLVSMLRAILPLGALSPPVVPQPCARPVGDAEIQEAEAPFSPSRAVAAACCSMHSTALCSLAAGCAAWLYTGSRMS